MNDKGCFLEFNPAAEAMFGCTREAVIGQPIDDYIIRDRLREGYRSGMKRFLATGVGPFGARLARRVLVHALACPVEVGGARVAGLAATRAEARFADLARRVAAQLEGVRADLDRRAAEPFGAQRNEPRRGLTRLATGRRDEPRAHARLVEICAVASALAGLGRAALEGTRARVAWNQRSFRDVGEEVGAQRHEKLGMRKGGAIACRRPRKNANYGEKFTGLCGQSHSLPDD